MKGANPGLQILRVEYGFAKQTQTFDMQEQPYASSVFFLLWATNQERKPG